MHAPRAGVRACWCWWRDSDGIDQRLLEAFFYLLEDTVPVQLVNTRQARNPGVDDADVSS